MRSSLYVCTSLAALCASIAPAAATVTISKQPTQNMTCSGGLCGPTAVDAVLNVQDLEAMLASGNVTVTTTGGGVEADSIVIGARLTWSTANLLRLQAFHSIKVDRPVTVTGGGGVWLIPNNGANGGFSCNDTGRLQFSSLSSALIIANTSYTLVNSVAALASAIAANPSGAFALAKDYNAKKDGTYVSPPIPTAFSGSFNGLGNTISNLSINDPTENAYVGLFAETTGTIANVRLVGENVQGGSGTSITSSTEYIGGLVGYAMGGSVTNSFTSGTIAGGDYVAVGGLLGFADGNVLASGSAASVSSKPTPGGIGGLIGFAKGSITESYATGNASGAGFVGGLVGFYFGPLLDRSWASGAASSTDNATWVGGLAGMNQLGTIERSHASGIVTCAFGCGGLVGFEGGGGDDSAPTISQSFSTASVSADINASDGAGGLVGWNELGEISNSYATGAVTAASAGGLVEQNEDFSGDYSISDSYSTGVVTDASTGYAGGLVAFDDNHGSNTINRTYWDTTTSGITDLSQGAGSPANDPGIKGLSDSQLKSGLPRGFSSRIWNENPNINGGLPYLIANPPPG